MDAETEILRQTFAVIAVFALLAGAIWKLRSGGVRWPHPAGAGARVASAGRIALTPQHSIHVVRIDGRELVVATHPHGCTLLDTLPRPPRESHA